MYICSSQDKDMEYVKKNLLAKLENLGRKIDNRNPGNEIVTINSTAVDKEDNFYQLSVEVEIIKDQSVNKIIAKDYEIIAIHLFKNLGDDAPFIITRDNLYDAIKF